MRKKLTAACKVAVSVIVLIAVVVQFVHGVRGEAFSAVNFFSFFTIEANIFGAIILLISARQFGKKNSILAYWRGAATLYMLITGIVYVALLSGADVQTPIPWVNAVLHYIFPVAMLLDWIIDRPAQKLSTKKVAPWLVFPIVYILYSLIRGPVAGSWYPYPFVDVSQLGYGRVALNSVLIAPGVIVLALLVVGISRIGTNPKKS